MIEVEGLRKEYGDFTAVNNNSFSIDEGEIFGIIGPNGAGKTTTLKMLAGLIEPTRGSIDIAGYKPQSRKMKKNLGYLPEESPLYEEMKGVSYLKFFADLYDVPKEKAKKRIHKTLDKLDLEHRNRKIGKMSKGMKRKIAITRSLVNNPEVLIYDEPASGLDPLTTNYIIDFTKELKKSGKTVVFSAHNLYHVESICDNIIIMNEGEIVARGQIDDIREKYGDVSYHIYTDTKVDGCKKIDGSDNYKIVTKEMEHVRVILDKIEKKNGEVLDIRTKDSSLEEIFLDVAQN